MRPTIFLLSFFSFCFLQAQISFEPAVKLLDHPDPDAYWQAPFIPFDANGDAYMDMAVMGEDGEFIYYGSASGDFTSVEVDFNISALIKIVDFEGDGDNDVLTRNRVLINDGNDFSVKGLSTESIVDAADVDQDGFLDLLVVDNIVFEDDTLRVYWNNGDNTYDRQVVHNAWNYDYFEISDIDGDGDLDVFSTIPYSSDPSGFVFDNVGGRSFDANEIDLPEFESEMVSLEDWDQDGDQDLLILDDANLELSLVGNVDDFESNSEILEMDGEQAYVFRMVDLDNDGLKDIIGLTSLDLENQALFYKKNITGTVFADMVIIDDGRDLPSISGAPQGFTYRNNISHYDYDNDGDQDLIYTDGIDEDGVFLLENTSIVNPCALGDLVLTSQTDVDNLPTVLGACTTIRANVTISGSDIVNLNGLNSVEQIYGSLIIEENAMLSNLSGLEALQLISLKLIIKDNPILTDISSLSESALPFIPQDDLIITGNASLSDCSIKSVCGFLQFDMFNLAQIENNAGDCNSAEAIKNACLNSDFDMDGFIGSEDCDDTNADINPNAIEVCDEVDNNCDGEIDEGVQTTFYYDIDMDGYGGTGTILACEITVNYLSELTGDCDDNNPNINPDATEIPYNGIDEDCDPLTLDDDLDQDGFLMADDCNDMDATINPDAVDVPGNMIDEDCDGMDTSGVADLLAAQIKLYPNPTSDLLKISSELNLVSFEIKNTLGQTVSKGAFTKQLDVSNIGVGKFLLYLKDHQDHLIRKTFVKL